jgi:hypothetical protein
LELLYIGYFGHAADGPGLSFWLGQNTVAQAGGQSEAVALAGIANSFMPQAETDVLYPSLASVGVDPATPAAQTELAAFVGDIYENLFDRAADSSGATYWVQQITSGAATLGSVILAIANGAVGTDAIQLQNKITVALDFTTATNAAGLDGTGPASAAFLAAASAVMSGVDGTSLNDTSVTAGENATTAYIAAAEKTSSQTLASGDEPSMLANPIVVSAANIVVDPGAGDHAIQFIGGSGADTIVLHSNATDQIAGFNLAAGDVLDLSSLLAETQVNARDVLSNMNAYVTIVDQGANAALLFDPSGHGGGTAVAMLLNLGATVTNLGVLTSHDAILT